MPFTRETRILGQDEAGELFSRQEEPFLAEGFVKTGDSPSTNLALENLLLRCLTWLKEQARAIGQVGVGHIPFVLVVPPRFLSFETLLGLAKVESIRSKEGRPSAIELLDKMTNVDPTPLCPYLLVDGEDGTALRRMSEENIDRTLCETRRRTMNAWEGISLVRVFPETLRDHGIVLSRSFFKFGGEHFLPKVGVAGLFREGTHMLFDHITRISHREVLWSTPSYARRIVANEEP